MKMEKKTEGRKGQPRGEGELRGDERELGRSFLRVLDEGTTVVVKVKKGMGYPENPLVS